MKSIGILDCTLRDGAQVNEARFGVKAATDIAANLSEAGIDIIECGFIKECEFEPGRTYYPQPSDMIPYIPKKKEGQLLSALMDYGRYDVTKLEDCDGRSVDLIRISFFEWHLDGIKDFLLAVKNKGYLISIQPMDTFSYTDEDLDRIIDIANEVKPYMLAMVDTYSIADEDAIDRVYSKYRARLDKSIRVGFHSHNNQLNSFGLAKHFIKISEPDRHIMCDASLFGMGRGGGNLNTEIFTEHLNRQGLKQYKIKNILDMVDTYSVEFKKKYEWGYSMPMLYAGLYGVHVFTTAYLEKKPGVTSYDLKCMFEMLDSFKKKRYDYDYLDGIYDEYMKKKEQKENE